MKYAAIALTVILAAIIAVFAFDAMQPKRERKIQVIENYVPPSPQQIPAAQGEDDLTPMPTLSPAAQE